MLISAGACDCIASYNAVLPQNTWISKLFNASTGAATTVVSIKVTSKRTDKNFLLFEYVVVIFILLSSLPIELKCVDLFLIIFWLVSRAGFLPDFHFH
jgi:hypothetical protein